MDIFEKKNALSLTEFDRYVIEHPKFAAKIPHNAQAVLQVEDDELGGVANLLTCGSATMRDERGEQPMAEAVVRCPPPALVLGLRQVAASIHRTHSYCGIQWRI